MYNMKTAHANTYLVSKFVHSVSDFDTYGYQLRIFRLYF